MINTSAAEAKKNLDSYIDCCIRFGDVVNIASNFGNVVMVNEEEYKKHSELLETLKSIGRAKEDFANGNVFSQKEAEARLLKRRGK